MPLDSLHRTLGEQLQADDNEHGYLLLDPMLREPLEARELLASGCDIFRIPVDRPQLHEDQWPKLVKLRPAAVEMLLASISLAMSEQSSAELEGEEGFVIGGWLRSSAEPRVLVRHLQSLMLPSEPRVGRRYLRLADRRVFEWIWPVLSPLQRQQWLGPINRWWALNRRNELVLHAMTEAVPEEPHHDPELLTAAQWTRLHDCELAQQILRGWSSFADPLPADYVPQAEHALRSVRSLGVAEPADIVLMSAYQLQIHPRFCEHPRVVELVRTAQNSDVPLQDALAGMPDPEGWDRIRHELTTGSPPNPLA
ncbi:DUF4123 domain-containing protein [Ralstonia pseudosolanacearum]|uniref:DUF4123 domain-containing protein n=1 Tax=Ralstonia pseudosolanacearum TaxID=1310165 RepID=UPI000AB18967|nr:DUF4123 domain-containing protein [Ralstonia pseudosolanacearum]MDC6294598.1 DUF4123 domain-containing protein [Ralstonia pseudosolanacearum]MDD7788746.1 DUF4123 domain-containing protein [Ralstonia pseudosolanacearum]MDN3370185.1 DUF4123 domain-containing protein [Ralstonia pseudosolanacearum]